jgi:hypothetical protein
MADLHGSNSTGTTETSPADNTGIHYQRVLDVIPDALKNASPTRLKTLETLQPQIPEWYGSARETDRHYLKQLIDERWRLQGVLDKTLGRLQHDIDAFAEPLLDALLQSNFNTTAKANELSVELEVPSKIAFVIDNGATRVRKSTLLEAALHNFEASETAEDAWRSGSSVYRKDPHGRLAQVPEIPVSRFASLCRDLDIGGQYQKHIKSILLPDTSKAQQTLQRDSIASEKAAFHLASLIARLKGDISAHAYDKLRDIQESRADISLYDQPLRCHRLSLMGFRLTGIVLFSAVSEPSKVKRAVEALTPDNLKFWLDWSRRIPVLPGHEYEQYKLLQAFFANGPQGVANQMLRNEDIYQQSRLSGPVIAYVPDDPDHPLKEYPSLIAFMKTLIGQLRDTEYQAFFSRFVAHRDKGHFFARVNERLTMFTWHQREPLDMGPWWRETAVESPNAEPITNLITGDLWLTLFFELRDKAIADARHIAVPTDDEDATARFKRLTSYLSIGWNIFNFTAMLIPGLGEAMLAIMVAQMLAELGEGVEDWSKGDREQASRYINGVLINFAQLALMGAGHVLPTATPVPISVSPFVEGLKPVEFNGQERLWNPDLRPYERPITLPGDAPVSELGFFRHQDQELLRLDDTYYGVMQDPDTGQYRLQHPTRPDAYQPPLEHNGSGSWKTELDQPLEWDKRRLLRRLGASVDNFSEDTLEQVSVVSGVHEDVLRRLHVEHEMPPASLIDTIKRFTAHADAEACAERVLSNRIDAEWADFVPRFMTQWWGWPEGKAIEVFNGPDLSGPSIKEGFGSARPEHTLQMTRAELVAGQLPERVVAFLDEHELHEVLGEWLGGDREARVQAIRELLGAMAGKSRKRLFDSLYSRREYSTDPRVQQLKSVYPDLSTSMAEEVLRHAKPADLQHLSEKQRASLNLAQWVRQGQQQERLARAYEGLYLEKLYNADTTRLILHSLESLPGWPKDLLLEIREFGSQGRLSDSIGPADAPIRKVLIIGDDGQFQTRDELDQHLHGEDTLYAAVLHALPDAQRTALGFDIHEAERLENLIKAHPLARDRFAPVLLDNPVLKPSYDPAVMRLRGGMQGYAQQVPHGLGLRRRARSLYPGFTQAQVEALLTGFTHDGGSVHAGLGALEAEFNQLNRALQRWLNSPTDAFRLSARGTAQWQSRNQLYKAIKQCWRRTGPAGAEAPGVMLPQALLLDDVPMMGRHLATLPKLEANFDHVTVLSLANGELDSGHESFLAPFRRLRQLNLQGNRLTTFPSVLSEMRHLTDLYLPDNRIELDVLAVHRLKNMTRLRSLDLSGNPLKLAPDVSRMPGLQTLQLSETGLDGWPVGLFAQPRPHNIYLDLRNNPITRIPDVAPGSFRAELLARTVINRELRWLSPQNLDTLRLYIESVGMDPERPYPPRGTLDSADWIEGLTESQWMSRQQIWFEVEDEFDSLAFFNEIRKLTQSADFTAGGNYRADLTAKVWRMLEAMAEDSKLRVRLFNEAAAPTQCVDGGTQLFNAMGVQVLIHEAYALGRVDLIEAQLLELAVGKSRLDELGAIARKRVAARLSEGERFRRVDELGNVTGTIDEVEVHLAYMTDLAERLDLPWQARGMQFRKIAGVSRQMIDAAFERIVALEEGDLLVDRLLDQPVWMTWLESAHTEELHGLKREMDATIELQDALQRRLEEAALAPQARADLEAEIEALCRELGKSADDYANGRLMSDDEYVQALSDIDQRFKQRVQALTRQAMERVRLPRLERPFRQ